MESADSRKRPLDSDSDSGVTKRSNQGSDNVHLKVLIPSIAAGAIIGKGGETITQIQKDTGATVKMSKNNDFYPGTTERVCLITGTADSVHKVNQFIMERIREKPDPNPKPCDGELKANFERHKQMKILVPNSTAGMIIGKGGAFIRQIKDESGAYVQVSQKSKDMSLQERCVTIAGDTEQNKEAMEMVLEKIMEDPQSGSCPNISYADVKGPVASSNPTGSPFASGAANRMDYGPGNVFGNIGNSMNNLNLNSGGGSGGAHGGNMAGSGSGGGNGSVSNPALENLKATLRGSGYSEQATEEISAAMYTLANYGFLGLGLGLAGLGIGLGAGMQGLGGNVQGGQGGPHGPQGMGHGGQGGPPGNLSLANLAGILGGAGMGQGGQGHPQGNMNSAGGGNLLNSGTPQPPNNGAGDGNPSVFGPVGSTTTTMAGGDAGQGGSSYFASSDMGGGGNSYSGGAGGSMFDNQYSHSNNTSFGSSGGAENGTFSGTNQNSFGLGTGMSFQSSPNVDSMGEGEEGEDEGGITKKELEVGEHIVGAILGPGGKGIVELQKFTCANIQISKKGVYAPGTRNRIVTVTGTSSAVQRAQYLIQQRITHEETKRARQNNAGQNQGPSPR